MATMFAAQTLPRTAPRAALRSARASARVVASASKTNTVVDAAIANPAFSVLVEAVVKVRPAPPPRKAIVPGRAVGCVAARLPHPRARFLLPAQPQHPHCKGWRAVAQRV